MAIPQSVYDNPDFMNLSGSALRLLIDMAIQYNGSNNGDLTAAMGHMKNRGWTSEGGLSKAVKELQDARLLIRTREGRFKPRMCALYAITWHSIDECQGKHLQVEPTASAPRKFSMEASNVIAFSK